MSTPEREREIKEAAIKNFEAADNRTVSLSEYREAFRRGARWADHHPAIMINKPQQPEGEKWTAQSEA